MRRFSYPLAAIAAFLALSTMVATQPRAQAPIDPPGLDRAMAAKDAHVYELIETDGVVGVGVGLAADGQAAVVVMTEGSGVRGLPSSLDGAPVVIRVTGPFNAIAKRETTASFTSTCAQLTCVFDGSGSFAPGGSYEWFFADDGTNAFGKTTSHTFPSSGTYDVMLTVTHKNGGDDFATEAVLVSEDGDPDPSPQPSDDPCESDPTATCARPVPTGVSTGNGTSCSAGTIGFRVTDDLNVYAMSNNHVYGLSNGAKLGDPIVQPGNYDTNCAYLADNVIGTLHSYVPFDLRSCSNAGENYVDVAIALSSKADLASATPGGGYTPSADLFDDELEPLLGLSVKKTGRTTDLTTGTVTVVNWTGNIGYNAGTACFHDQIIVEKLQGGPVIKSGDSGSGLVTDDADAQPVGLLYAGNASGKVAIANHIQDVLDALAGVPLGDSPSLIGPEVIVTIDEPGP